uniref:Voltage-dependent T-type calcium 3b n=1 Tax=Petromyzon marinus TaxID=7757 RepID=A0A482IAQ9_PETMA|nr:voltage-dependent T-type calcium 3b [Petromyzon marinus]
MGITTWNTLDGFLVLVSLVDIIVSLASDSGARILGILRVLRLLRTLRPLRVISRAPGLKLVVETLITSLKPIGNIVLICCAFFIIFGILGVQDGWVNIMYTGLDAVGLDQQPVINYNPWMLLYFISFLLLVSFFVLNMFVGVVVENFHNYLDIFITAFIGLNGLKYCNYVFTSVFVLEALLKLLAFGIRRYFKDSRHATFENFGMALLTLFRVSTGDNWNGIMKDTLRECSSLDRQCISYLPVISPIYFVTFVLTAQFVLVNVVVAVLMKHLEDSAEDAHEEEEEENAARIAAGIIGASGLPSATARLLGIAVPTANPGGNPALASVSSPSFSPSHFRCVASSSSAAAAAALAGSRGSNPRRSGLELRAARPPGRLSSELTFRRPSVEASRASPCRSSPAALRSVDEGPRLETLGEQTLLLPAVRHVEVSRALSLPSDVLTSTPDSQQQQQQQGASESSRMPEVEPNRAAQKSGSECLAVSTGMQRLLAQEATAADRSPRHVELPGRRRSRGVSPADGSPRASPDGALHRPPAPELIPDAHADGMTAAPVGFTPGAAGLHERPGRPHANDATRWTFTHATGRRAARPRRPPPPPPVQRWRLRRRGCGGIGWRKAPTSPSPPSPPLITVVAPGDATETAARGAPEARRRCISYESLARRTGTPPVSHQLHQQQLHHHHQQQQQQNERCPDGHGRERGRALPPSLLAVPGDGGAPRGPRCAGRGSVGSLSELLLLKAAAAEDPLVRPRTASLGVKSGTCGGAASGSRRSLVADDGENGSGCDGV